VNLTHRLDPPHANGGKGDELLPMVSETWHGMSRAAKGRGRVMRASRTGACSGRWKSSSLGPVIDLVVAGHGGCPLSREK
jgi:hypothetical protein